MIRIIEMTDFVEQEREGEGLAISPVLIPTRFHTVRHIDIPDELAHEIMSRAGFMDHHWPNVSKRIRVTWHRDDELIKEHDPESYAELKKPNRCVMCG